MCYNYACLTNIIITQTDLVWPFTIPQLTDLHKHNYNTNLLSMVFYNTSIVKGHTKSVCVIIMFVKQLVVVL
jgi:hypothetical protein